MQPSLDMHVHLLPLEMPPFSFSARAQVREPGDWRPTSHDDYEDDDVVDTLAASEQPCRPFPGPPLAWPTPPRPPTPPPNPRPGPLHPRPNVPSPPPTP